MISASMSYTRYWRDTEPTMIHGRVACYICGAQSEQVSRRQRVRAEPCRPWQSLCASFRHQKTLDNVQTGTMMRG